MGRVWLGVLCPCPPICNDIVTLHHLFFFQISIFRGSAVEDRLDPSDADFVDVIHADDYMGMSEACGHKDFYLNGGSYQPGCASEGFDLLGLEQHLCSHKRARQIFIESLDKSGPCASPRATRCDSWQKFLREECNGNSSYVLGINAVKPNNDETKIKTKKAQSLND